jgi:hypothetical protein
VLYGDSAGHRSSLGYEAKVFKLLHMPDWKPVSADNGTTGTVTELLWVMAGEPLKCRTEGCKGHARCRY